MVGPAVYQTDKYSRPGQAAWDNSMLCKTRFQYLYKITESL